MKRRDNKRLYEKKSPRPRTTESDRDLELGKLRAENHYGIVKLAERYGQAVAVEHLLRIWDAFEIWSKIEGLRISTKTIPMLKARIGQKSLNILKGSIKNINSSIWTDWCDLLNLDSAQVPRMIFLSKHLD